MFIGIGIGLVECRYGTGSGADVTAPTITSTGPSAEYVDGSDLGGTLTADEAVTWSKSGPDAALVTLNAGTGVWTLPTLDFATKAAYDWTFTATDGASLTDTQQWAFAVVEEAEIPTPVITKTSDAGDPITFSMAALGEEVIGLYWKLEVASDAGFTTPVGGKSVTEEIRQITSTDFTDDDADTIVEMDAFDLLSNQQAGAFYVRISIGHDDGIGYVWGTASNTINDTVVILTASTYDATAKYSNIALTGGALIARNGLVNVGAEGRVRLTNSRTGKRYCEFTLTELTTLLVRVGIGPSTHAWTTVSNNTPGTLGSPAGTSCSAGGSVQNNGVTTGSVITSCSVGDIICVAFDTTATKVWFGRIPSGGSTITWNGDPAAGTGGFTPTGMDVWYGFASINVTNTNQRTVTFNGGASAFVGTIPSGFSAYT